MNYNKKYTHSARGGKSWSDYAFSWGLPMGIVYSIIHKDWVLGMTGGAVAGVLYGVLMSWMDARRSKHYR